VIKRRGYQDLGNSCVVYDLKYPHLSSREVATGKVRAGTYMDDLPVTRPSPGMSAFRLLNFVAN